MESPFEYNQPVYGTNFVGRKKEVSEICSLLRERNNILIFGQARIGKKSLIYNSLETLRSESYDFTLSNFNLFNVRCVEALMLKFVNSIFACFSISGTEGNNILKKYLPSAPYMIANNDNSISVTYTKKSLLSDSQILEILKFPDLIAKEYNTHIIIYLEQFQDILLFDDAHRVLKLIEQGWQNLSNTNFIITGERINAMKEIFEMRKYFYKFAYKIEIIPIDEDIFADYIIKGFLKTGKVISRDLALQIFNIVGGDPWYAQHLASICYDNTKGYLSEQIFEKAVWCLINLHDFQFHSVTFGLTRHQLRFIKAILAGVTKFSSVDILDKYNLNSSANVNRVKEALLKKEIITFNGTKEATFMDPLFKLWLIKYFYVK